MNGIMWGICLIFLGIGLLGSFTGLFSIFFKGWWTIFIIGPAIVDFFTKANKTWSLLLLATGITLFVQQQGIIETSMVWKVLLAFGIIIIGLNIVFLRDKNERVNIPFETLNKNASNTYSSLFNGQEIKYDNEKFTGASIAATFGGFKLDLRNAIIENDTIIEINTVFGGCEIIVPKNINVKINSTGILGGVTNKTNCKNSNSPTIYIKSSAVFGGTEIKHL